MRQSTQRKPVQQHAIAFLRAHIQELSPQERLIPARQLASLAEVSFVTMVKALRELRATGEISLSNGRIYRKAADSPGPLIPAKPPQASTPGRHPLVQAMADDLRNGAFRPGLILPSFTELQKRYHTGYRRVKKAVQQLIADGTLQIQPGGRVAIPAFQAAAYKSRIVCFVPSIDSYSLLLGQNGKQVFRAFETQCAQANTDIDLQIVFLDDSNRVRFRNKRTGTVYDLNSMDKMFDTTVLGYACFPRVSRRYDHMEDDYPIIKWCLGTKRQICIFDESGFLTLSRDISGSRRIRLIQTVASPDPGAAIGRHLLSLGHRRVAFFSTFSDCFWSTARLTGLKSAFKDAGYGDGVSAFIAENRLWWEAGAERANMPSLVTSYRKWRSRTPEICRCIYDSTFEKLRFDGCMNAEMLHALRPLMERALDNSRCTAWVMANDLIASMAMDFLQQRRVRIPADLSLVSFDDSELSLEREFSSYNFNYQAIAAEMLGFILGRKPYCETDAPPPGFIMDRGTIGPARRT